MSNVADNETLVLRELELSDYQKGYMDLLSQLTTVGDVTFDQFRDTFENLQKSHDNSRIFVVEDIEKEVIVASATLLVEFKFIHSCSKVGHIEDVVVNSSYRGKGLGFRIIDECKKWGKEVGCYKIILDCNDGLKSFYKRFGFNSKQVQMSLYFDD